MKILKVIFKAVIFILLLPVVASVIAILAEYAIRFIKIYREQ